jgi:hypothetical protein
MTVEIPNIEALNKVLKALRKVDSVYEVRRKNKILKRIKVNTGLAEETNCYIVQDKETLETIVIDPGSEADRIIEIVGYITSKT